MTSPQTPFGHPSIRNARVKIGFAALGMALLLILAWYSRHELVQVAGNLRPGVLLAAIAAGIALNFLQGIYFAQLMRKNGSTTSTRECVSAFLIGQPGKYLPGKIWAPLIQQATLGRPGQLMSIGTANVELALVVLVQMACLGFACLALGNPGVSLASVAAGIMAGAGALKLQWAAPLVRRFSFLRARSGVMADLSLWRSPALLPSLLLSTAVMACTLLASWLVLASMGWPWDTLAHAQALGAVFLGFASSLLAFPVPVGLGVREAATAGIGAVAAPEASAAMLVSIAVFARGWQLAVDAASLLIGLRMASAAAPARPPEA